MSAHSKSFLSSLRTRTISRLSELSDRLCSAAQQISLKRENVRILIFFHGYSLAHTIRPLLIGRALRERGYDVQFAGVGTHRNRIIADQFQIHEVETMPQSRMDEYVSRGDYAYYDLDWIRRCVASERELIRTIKPNLLIGDLRPTLKFSAAMEGVDLALVEAAYNQPGYPFPIPLPQSFPVSPGSFDEFAIQQKNLRKHSVFYLVADVPEFHPPGANTPSYYHYIGPLIEEPPEPPIVPELSGEGWDKSLPLICVNCGSTGADVTYIEALIRALAAAGYRLLVTTAGRLASFEVPQNVRIVDFIPLSWVLKRAKLLIGIGGIGSIYHALNQGIPIVGAPEHLDQEYHLNRVGELGVGRKLSWDDFRKVNRIVDAVGLIYKNYDKFETECKRLSAHIKKWHGGREAANVVDLFFLRRQALHHIDAEHLISEAEFAHYLKVSAPPGLTGTVIRNMLRANLGRGLPHVKSRGGVYFDRFDSWNWLYDHEPRFFESDYLGMEKKRKASFAIQNRSIVSCLNTQRYRLTCQYRVYPVDLLPVQQVVLFMPYPITTDHQLEIQLGACTPNELDKYLIPTAGYFYGYPVPVGNGDQEELREFSYECEFTVKERAIKKVSSAPLLSPREYRRYTEVDPDLGENASVREYRKQLGLSSDLTDYEKAYRIYAALVQSKRFKKTKDQCQCLKCSTLSVLSDSGGHCITLSNTLIALCRLEGIPARPITGTLSGYPIAEGCFQICTYNEPLWGHTWVEVYTKEFGWIPVEFQGIVIGTTAMTEENVVTTDLRNHIANQGNLYLDYYFGNVDCHRVVGSSSILKIPPILLRETSASGMPKITVPRSLRYEGSLILKYI